MPESTGVIAQETQLKEEQKTYQPPKEWEKMLLMWRTRLSQSKNARNTQDRKLDNQTFIQDFYSNEDAVNSYLRPKKNDDEVRVVGGTTEKRIESIVNELQSMNFQHEIQAFDSNDLLIEGLGKAMEDAVSRSNQIEEDEDTCSDAIWELVTQRACFVEEVVEERRVGEFVQKMCKKRVRSAIEVIVGDLTMAYYKIQEQPFIATYDRMSLATFKMLYGHLPNAEYVRGGQDLSGDVYGSNITFRLGILAQDEVELIHCMSVPDNEHCFIANGVPLTAPGTPLPFQYPFPRYPLAVAIPKRMSHHYFYGRSVASGLKYLQAFSDETVRNIIRKFRQAIEPPRAVRSQERIYTRDMYVAGKISYGVDADALKPLTTHAGVTDAEMTVMNLTRQLQDELAGRSAIQGGATPSGKQTATATIEQQKQAVKMLGQIVLAYSTLIRQWTKNRVFNLIETFSDPDGLDYNPATEEFVEQYRRFTLRDQPLDNGKNGDRIVQFVGKDLSDQDHEKIEDWELEQQKQGKPKRLSIINIKKVRKAALYWYVTVASKPKDSDDLHKIMFDEKLNQGAKISQMTGKQLNAGLIADEFEQTWRAKDWFKSDEMPVAGEEMLAQDLTGQDGVASKLGAQMTAGTQVPLKGQQAPNPESLKQVMGAPKPAIAPMEA